MPADPASLGYPQVPAQAPAPVVPAFISTTMASTEPLAGFSDNPAEDTRHLQQLQRMAMLGTLAAGLGHDLRNLVMPILLRLDVLSASKDMPEEARDDLASIRASITHLQRLASGLKLLAADPFNPRDESHITTLPEWWRDMQPIVVDTLSSITVIEVDIPPTLPRVAVPPGALAQVMLNLVMNARRAMETTPAPRLTLAARTDEGVVCLDVIDNGVGMDEPIRRRCFEPFFTTRPRELATGLGLSVGRALMNRYGGDLTLSPVRASGAGFRLHLPVHNAAGRRLGGLPSRNVQLRLSEPRQEAMVRHMLTQRGLKEWSPDTEIADRDVIVCDVASLDDVLRTAETARVIVVGAQPPNALLHGDVTWVDPRHLSTLGDVVSGESL